MVLAAMSARGEHGTTVVYADRFIPDDEKKRARETGERRPPVPEAQPVCRAFSNV